MSDEQSLLNEPDPAPETAAQAFARLDGRIALMSRAVEHLAAERASIDIPDYSATLGEIAQRLAATAQGMKTLAARPAMQITPNEMAGRIDAAAVKARQTDRDALTESHRRFDEASHDLRAVVRSARSADDQLRRQRLMTAGGMLVGILLWSIVPGLAARIAPESWRWPERLAARSLRLDMWGAGERMLARSEPERWQTVVLANRILQDNREAIARCRSAADKVKEIQRCIVVVTPGSASQNPLE
ncbi:MAG: DUF6118 family protein [Sphingomonas bacterium]